MTESHCGSLDIARAHGDTVTATTPDGVVAGDDDAPGGSGRSGRRNLRRGRFGPIFGGHRESAANLSERTGSSR